MFVIKKFKNESLIRNFKMNIITHTYKLDFSFSPRKIGLYSKIVQNVINIKNVCEDEERGGPICIHFYGVIFLKKYLLGIICPQMWYSIFTLGIWMIKDEYLSFKIIALIIWIYIYLSNFNNVKFIYQKIISWMGNTGDGSVS